MRYPLELELAPSRRALVLIAAIHLVAAIAFLLSSLPGPLRILALVALGGSLLVARRGERAKAGLLIVLDDSGKLVVRRADAAEEAQPERGCADFGWAIWLQWRVVDASDPRARRRAAMMLLPDNVPASAWRGLRIWLKHKALASQGPDASVSEEAG